MKHKVLSEIRKQLIELTKDSTNIHISKRELFDLIDTNIEYYIIAQDIDIIIEEFCEEYNFQYTLRVNENNKCEYFITTELVETDIIDSTRNRIYIPANIVRAAGFIPHDQCLCIKTSNKDGMTVYMIIHTDMSYKYDYYVDKHIITVEKDGGIRFAVSQFEIPYTASASAGMIIAR